MEPTTPSDPIRLELYVRTLSPPGARTRQEEVIDDLQHLEDADHVADAHVHVWGRQIDPTTNAADTEQGQFVLNRIAEFKQWALANNTTLDSFYETREQSSSITGADHTSIILPKMGLAEYHGAELAQVSPCSEPDSVYTITDHLEDLRHRATDSTPGQPTTTPVAEE